MNGERKPTSQADPSKTSLYERVVGLLTFILNEEAYKKKLFL